MLDRVLKARFHLGCVDARLEPRCEALDGMDYIRDFLPLFDKTVGCPCAEGPAPEHHLVALVDECQVLAITTHDLLDVFVLKTIHRFKVHEVSVTIFDS